MVNYDFWRDWKRKTKLEENAIRSIKSAKEIILKNIPKEEIIAIYAKGSFVRREMNKESDVDTLTILKHSKLLDQLPKLEEKYKNKLNPKIQITGYSLWELKRNKKAKNGKVNRPGPSRTVQHLEHYQLIYGNNIKKSDLHQGDNTKRLRTMIQVFRTILLPSYERSELSFSDILKQVFWLVEDEQRVRGKKTPYHWGKLAKMIKDKEHIIHDTLRLRKTNSKKEQLKFLHKLNEYLLELEKIV